MTNMLALLMALAIAAQPISQQASDQDALDILRMVNKKYTAYKDMKMDFVLNIDEVGEGGLSETKEGQIWIKEDMFRLKVDEQLIVCDNETIWTYLEDVNELQINFFEEDEEIILPSQLFTMAESDFFVILGERIQEEGKSLQVIEMTPLDKDKTFHKIKLFIDKEDKSVKRASVLDKSGVHFKYNIDAFKSNNGLTSNDFKFDATSVEGIEIIDLRE